MIDKIKYISDGNTKYPMAFTINVMERIEDEYGGLKSWVSLVDKEEPSYKAIKFMVLEVINEGLDISGKDEALSSKEVGRLITRVGLDIIGTELLTLISESLPKSDSKNKIPMQSKKKR